MVGRTPGRLVETGCVWIPRFSSVLVMPLLSQKELVFEIKYLLRWVPTKPDWQNVGGYYMIAIQSICTLFHPFCNNEHKFD